MPEQEHDEIRTDVAIHFEVAKRMLFGLPTDCENCGLKYHIDDEDLETVQGYEYPQTGRRVLLCDDCAVQRGFCPGCLHKYTTGSIRMHLEVCDGIDHE